MNCWNSLLFFGESTDDNVSVLPTVCQQPSKRPRIHAFHPPFDFPRQFIPWITLASSYGCFFGFCVNSNVHFRPFGWEAWTSCYVGMTLVMFLFGIITSYIISPHISAKDEKRDGTSLCSQCGIKRTPLSKTHHCSHCNRCADQFDHRKCTLCSMFYWLLLQKTDKKTTHERLPLDQYLCDC
jgi:hypothetical protein